MKEKKDQSMQVALVAFGISFLNMNLTCCMCGHMGWISLPGNVVAEKANIAEQHPDIVKSMSQTLKQWRQSCKDSASGKDY
jgi:hypothetical protein